MPEEIYRPRIFGVPSGWWDPNDEGYSDHRIFWMRRRKTLDKKIAGSWMLQKTANGYSIFVVCPRKSCRSLLCFDGQPDCNDEGYPESDSACTVCDKCGMHMWLWFKGWRPRDADRVFALAEDVE